MNINNFSTNSAHFQINLFWVWLDYYKLLYKRRVETDLYYSYKLD